MEIHFYESTNVIPTNVTVIADWDSMNKIWNSLYNIEASDIMPEIHTIQMCMLSTTWLLKDYRLFIHQNNGIINEIVLRDKNNQGDNAIRVSQNMYAMWANNIFRK